MTYVNPLRVQVVDETINAQFTQHTKTAAAAADRDRKNAW
jgi:hypothetical protein